MYGFTTLFIVASTTFSLLTSAAPTQPESGLEKRDQPEGIYVSEDHQFVDWNNHKNNGVDFGYVMATRGNTHENPWFNSQFWGCRSEGLICGAYHVAAPTQSSGFNQASYFISRGGGWINDGRSLPGALVLGYNPGGPTCYGRSPSQLVTWIRNFSSRYHTVTNRYPVIVTTQDWWKECTNDDHDTFRSNNALWKANQGGRPRGWSRATIVEITPATQTEEGHLKWNGSPQGLDRFVHDQS